MSSRAISGKPGGGKSYYSVRLLIEELETTDRQIVTNIPLREDKILEYLSNKGRSDIDVYGRITRLDNPQGDESVKMSSFWRFRGNGVVLPDLSNEDIKGGKRPDPASFGGGVHYFLDELHKFLNSRQWAQTGPLLLWYISQHRHFGDDVTWITQHVPNVDKQWRSVTQDYTYLRNWAKESFRGFTKGSGFRAETYLEPFTGSQTPQEVFNIKADWKGIGSCYHTSIAHGSADKGAKKKGPHIFFLYGGILLAVCAFWYLGSEAPSWYLKNQAKTASKLKTPAASEAAAVGNVSRDPARRPSAGAPLDTPAIAPDSPVFNVAVPLQSITASEAVSAVPGSNGVSLRPSPSGSGVLVTGNNPASVNSSADAVRVMDSPSAQPVVIQAVILRTTSGASSQIGVWGTLRDVVASGGFGLDGLSWDPLTGIVTAGSVTAAQETIRLLGANDVTRYGFKVESRPLLASVSGRQAWFTSGKEVPVTTTTQNAINAQTGVTFKKVESSLGVTATVLEGNRIALDVIQSSQDIVGTAEVGGNPVPTIATQSLTTRIELVEGQLAIIGGVEVENSGNEKSGFPLLSEFPPVSWVFGNKKKNRERSELLVILTVYRVPSGSNPLPVRRAEPVKKKFPVAVSDKPQKSTQKERKSRK